MVRETVVVLALATAFPAAAALPASDLGNWQTLYVNAERFAQMTVASAACEDSRYIVDSAGIVAQGQALVASFGSREAEAANLILSAMDRQQLRFSTDVEILKLTATKPSDIARWKARLEAMCADADADPAYGEYFSKYESIGPPVLPPLVSPK